PFQSLPEIHTRADLRFPPVACARWLHPEPPISDPEARPPSNEQTPWPARWNEPVQHLDSDCGLQRTAKLRILTALETREDSDKPWHRSPEPDPQPIHDHL